MTRPTLIALYWSKILSDGIEKDAAAIPHLHLTGLDSNLILSSYIVHYRNNRSEFILELDSDFSEF